MAKVIFFDDIDFGILKAGSDEVSTSGKWLDNGIYFTNPKSENGKSKPHHIAHDSYIYTLGSNVKLGDEYASKTEDSSYYISVISGISADPFKKEITYDTTKYDLSAIFEDISNMKQQISEILGILNEQETVSSFTFSLSRTGIIDTSLSNFVVGEPILAKITDIIPSSAKYSYFNIESNDNSITKIPHTVDDEDSFYFNNATPTSVSASIMTGTENESRGSTNNVTVSYAPIYTYAYSCGIRVAGLDNININTTSSLQDTFNGTIHNLMFNSLKNINVETDSNITHKKLSDYYSVGNYNIYHNNSYTTTTGTPSLLTYAIKKQNTATYINTSVELNVQAYLVCYTIKTEDPEKIGDFDKYSEKKYSYISENINSATVEQYLGRTKEYYTFKNTYTSNNTDKEITSGTTKVSALPFTGNKPHRKDILITYTLNRPSGITIKESGKDEPLSSLNLTVGKPVNLVVTLDNVNNLHTNLRGITVDKTGDITVDKTSIASGDTITVKANGSGSITFSSINKTVNIPVSVTSQQYAKYLVKIEKEGGEGGNITGRTVVPLNEETPYGIKLLAPGTIKHGDKANTNYLSIVDNFPVNKTDKNNPPIELYYFATIQEFSIFKNDIDGRNIELTDIPYKEETIDGVNYYMIKSTSGSSGFNNGEEFYIQIK